MNQRRKQSEPAPETTKKSSPALVVDISVKTIIKATVAVLAVWLGFQFFVVIWPVCLWLITAIFLAVGLNPIVSRIIRYLPTPNRVLATAIAFGLVLTGLATFLLITVPPIYSQLIEFATDLPEIFRSFKDQDGFLANIINEYQLDDDISGLISNLSSRISDFEGGLTGILNALIGTVFNLVAVVVLTFLMLIEGPKICRQLRSLARSKKQLEQWETIGKKMYGVITAYINGQFLIATIGATTAGIFMVLLGVPNPLALAGIVGLLSLIPMVGAIAGAVLVVMLTLLVNVKYALIMAIFFFVYQQIENATIQPYIQSRNVALSVMTIFIVTIIGAKIAGIWGALLVVPATGCLKVLLTEYFRHSPHYRRYVTNWRQIGEADKAGQDKN